MHGLRRLLLGAPWLAIIIVALVHRAPTGPGVVELQGQWEWTAAQDPTSPTTEWRPIVMPGRFIRQGLVEEEFWLRRRFEWHGEVPSDMQVLAIGDLRVSVARLWVNGAAVSDISAYDERQKAELQALETVTFPTERLHEGMNELRLRVWTMKYATTGGIGDSRLLLGPSTRLGAWALRVTRLESFLRHAPLLVLALMFVLLLILRSLQADSRERHLLAIASALCVAAAFYLLFQTGLGLVGLIPFTFRVSCLISAIVACGWLLIEFIGAYFIDHATWYLRAMRIIAPLCAVAGLMEPMLLGTNRVYTLYMPWMLFCAIAVVSQSLASLRDRHDFSSLFMASTSLTLVASALIDVFTDLNIWSLPRVIALTMINTPILVGITLIARFIGLSERNTQLSISLSESNRELASALVEAQSATRAKSEFLASVSHELRTPLNSIINIPEGLLEDFEAGADGKVQWQGDAERTQKYLRTLHTAGTHLLGVVNQVLDFSKIEANRMVLHPENFAVGTLVDEVTQTIEGLARKRGITVVGQGGQQLALEADRVAVAQVLLNLASNAVKFSRDGGQVELLVAEEDASVVFRVSDHGIGIAPENLALIFESFRQVEGGATRRYGGTGLGLAIAKKLVGLHGGQLEVESTLGQGSTFIARFPRRALPQVAVPVVERPAHRVVIVDDEPIVTETFRLSLRPLKGVEVLAIDDPRRAIEFIEATRPALIVLDVMMPRISGLTLLQQLREKPAFKDTPVMVVSAYPSNRELVEPMGARWVSKPWDDKLLQQLVRELLNVREAGPEQTNA